MRGGKHEYQNTGLSPGKRPDRRPEPCAAAAAGCGVLSHMPGSVEYRCRYAVYRPSIAAFVLLAGIGGFVFARAPNAALLALGRFIIGFGVGVVYVAAMRILADWYRPDEMATYSGILLAVGNIGALISTTPLVILMEHIGWRHSFGVVAGLTVLAGVMTYKVIRNKPAELGFPAPRDRSGQSRVSAVRSVSFAAAVKAVFGHKPFYLLGLLLFSYYGSFMGVGSLWAGPYLQNIYGMSGQAAGNILMMFPLGMVIGCPLAGYLSNKVLKSRRTVLLWGCILHISCYVPFIFFTDQMPELMLYGLFFWYGLSGGPFVSCFACAREMYRAQFVGTAVGALNIFLFGGGAFYQYVMGLVIRWYPLLSPGVYSVAAYRAAFLVPACGLLLGISAFAFFREDPG